MLRVTTQNRETVDLISRNILAESSRNPFIPVLANNTELLT